MRSFSSIVSMTLLACGLAVAQGNPAGNGAAALAHGAATNKITYLVFHRTWDAPAQAVGQSLKALTDKHATRATWAAVAVDSPAEKAVVDRFQVARAPMPLVLAVHANGAVTGFFQKPLTEPEFVQALATPAKAECMKALQANRLVLLNVQGAGQADMPAGAKDFAADPQFTSRTQVLNVRLDDPNEAPFFTHLEINPQAAGPQTVLMAPPGVLVGKFPVTATKTDMAGALHKAGKCCDDKNCKHNH